MGHLTRELIDEALTLHGLPKTLALIRQEMHETPKTDEWWSTESGTRNFDITVFLRETLRRAGISRPN